MKHMLCFALLGMIAVTPSYAALWQTPDQEAQALLKKGLYAAAQQKFQRLDWRATAAFRAGDYQSAARDYLALHSLEGFYNAGNALAKLGQYQSAIRAYDQALALDPRHQDAAYNRRLVQKLLDKTQQQAQPSAAKPQTKPASEQTSQTSQTHKNLKAHNKPQKQQKQQDLAPKAMSLGQADREQKKANEQWLQLIPDDPGGLLRQKFLRDHLKRQGVSS